MTHPAVLVVAALALVVAGLAMWVVRPRPPDLDAERWFKVMLATLLRGRVEAEGGDADAWEAAVARWVPYHPAGRLPELKVTEPASCRERLPGPALEGELGLLQALAREPDLRARWARLYDDDPLALEALLADPLDLGPVYDPSRWLGPGATWDDLAAWGADGAAFPEALARAVDARWLLVGGRDRGAPDVGPVLASLTGARVVPWEEPLDALTDRVEAAVEEMAGAPGSRLVLVAVGEGIHAVLRALARDPGGRDRTLAVLSVGGVVQGTDEDAPWGRAVAVDWLGANFTHEALDTEDLRLTPWLALQWLDREASPPGFAGVSLGAQRFPEPGQGQTRERYVEPHDLGPLVVRDDLPVDVVARALVALVGAVVRARANG